MNKGRPQHQFLALISIGPGVRERLRTLPALDLAASQLRDAVKVLLDPPAGGLPAIWTGDRA